MRGRTRCPRSGLLLVMAAALGAGGLQSVAAAPMPTGHDQRGLQLVFGDAVAVVRADPAELERGAELVRSLGGDIGMAANVVSLASAGLLGFDALARAGWSSIGIDAGQPVFVALGPIDPTDPRARWHARAVARVADARAFADWAGRSPLLGEPWHTERPVRGALAALLGVGRDARAEADAARSLTQRGTIAVGITPSFGALVLVRRIGPYAVLDAFALAEIGQLAWPRDGNDILARLDGQAQGGAMSEHATAGAAALARPGLVFWTQPAGLFDAALTWSRPPPTCEPFRELAPRTALVDGALTLRITGARLSLDAHWSSAPGAPLTAAWPVADDGLLGPPLRSGAVLAASIYVAGTERLRALPRAEMIERGWVQLWRQARHCGRPARALLLGFAWPELAGQWLGDVAAVSAPAAQLVGAVRNLGFAARRVAAGDRRAWRAALEGSIAPAGMRPTQAVLDAVFGGQRASRRPRRHLAWDGVYLHPYALSRGKRGGVIGVAIGEGARRWRLAQPLRARRVRPRTLARAAGNAAALLRQLAPGLPPPLRVLAATAARRVGSFDGAVTVQADGVRASLTLRRR